MNQFILSSNNNFPNNPTILPKDTPLLLQVQPFANDNVSIVPVDSMKELPRCPNCRCFVNKLMQWPQNSARFVCGQCRRICDRFYTRYKSLKDNNHHEYAELNDDVYDFQYQQAKQ